ncbi:hypothetical protein [Nitrospirillum viridazoti]|uniref:Uncharacterized protein n=1 Tax=Nitrospirillum viridazoti CBAmc TaxID=1441467 RepID=A0A248K301_9PROT|nr:hypothetical protein [Nitrospirillum amazonense]ASG25136.1 hypothetical protein Y958_29675 [Nitrospirillum amazonense CBAmc]TWB28737.1 hypothetical protein FBZ91_12871 [Nitrospirillum amazonense]
MFDLPALIQPGAIGASLGIQPYTPLSMSAAPAGFGSAGDLGALANAAAPALPSSVGAPLGSAAQAAQLLGGGSGLATPSLGAPALGAPSLASPAIPGASSIPGASTASGLSNLASAAGVNTGLPSLPQAPSVAAPSLSAPTMAAPTVGTPSMAAPGVTPGFTSPTLSPTGLTQPSYAPPPVVATSSATPPLSPYTAGPQAGSWNQGGTLPGVQASSYQTPGYQVPGYQAPSYQAPSYQAPAFQTPGAGQSPLPSQTPTLGQTASALPSTGNADADSAVAVARILGQI